MIERYFQYQADLAVTESNMLCPEDCDAPGCRIACHVRHLFIWCTLNLNSPLVPRGCAGDEGMLVPWSRLAGAGFKTPQVALVKSHCGEY